MVDNKHSTASHRASLAFAFVLANHTRRTEGAGKNKFDQCSPGDWLNLQEGYFRFINSSPETSADRVKTRFMQEATQQRLKDVAGRFNERLREIARPGMFFGGQFRGVLNFHAQAPSEDAPFEPVVFLDASIDSAEFALWHHLTRSGVLRGQIHICPICGDLALLPKRPQKGKVYYCSPRCSRRAAYDAYIEAHGGKRPRRARRKTAGRRAAR